jgi:hypothetical protein
MVSILKRKKKRRLKKRRMRISSRLTIKLIRAAA